MKELSVNIKLPDLWQQEALRALQSGFDVIVNAPTGAGKTYIFELLVETGFKGKSIYTVPTRALANDKLLEWRKKNWDVGIATGDIFENLDAAVIVATLETQKRRFMSGEGPELLIIDEYQMLADSIRGVNYELIIATAPACTQLLLLSGSVANPKSVAHWLKKLGRRVELVTTSTRPVPLEEIFVDALRERIPDSVQGYWPQLIGKALKAGLGPIIAFAPKRQASEDFAFKISSQLPALEPLKLTSEQKKLAGKKLAGLLKNRIAYHHSGLSYRQRAGIVEPLAKAGQLRLVVATTGLGAGINFSMRSVLVTDREYRAGHHYHLVRPDELLQMFGRAGRRGQDEKGYILVASNKPRLNEGRPLYLKRPNRLEWPAFITAMQTALDDGKKPVPAAENLSRNLFTEKPVILGLEIFNLPAESSSIGSQLPDPENNMPPATFLTEILNFKCQWERRRAPVKKKLGETYVFTKDQWQPALQTPLPMLKLDVGRMSKRRLGECFQYGREISLARLGNNSDEGELVLTKWILRELRKLKKIKGKIHSFGWTLERLESELLPLLPQLTQGGVPITLLDRNGIIYASLDYAEAEILAVVDTDGRALLNPPVRTRKEDLDFSFRNEMEQIPEDGNFSTPAKTWRKLGLVDRYGNPTRRGIIFSLFNNGEGLAVAAALEEESYEIDELINDLANLRAGHRFEKHEYYSGRLGRACRQTYKGATSPGYLDRGIPPDYGDGAAEVIAEVATNQSSFINRQKNELLAGDIERAQLEWRSLLNQIANAPFCDWNRWTDLQTAARKILGTFKPPLLYTDLPELTLKQRHRCQSLAQIC